MSAMYSRGGSATNISGTVAADDLATMETRLLTTICTMSSMSSDGIVRARSLASGKASSMSGARGTATNKASIRGAMAYICDTPLASY